MNTRIGTTLTSLRQARGLSQEQLAAKLGLSRQAISNWERDESVPDTANLIALAGLYGVTLDELVGSSGDNAVEETAAARTSEPLAALRGRRAAQYAACFVASAAYYLFIAQPVLVSVVGDLAEILGLMPGPALTFTWIACEALFVAAPFVLLAAFTARLPRRIWIAPLAAFALPALLTLGASALAGSTYPYPGIGGALMSSVAIKVDLLAVASGSVAIALSARRSARLAPAT